MVSTLLLYLTQSVVLGRIHVVLGLDASNLFRCQSDTSLQASTDLAATYAALILADDGIEITVRYIHFP